MAALLVKRILLCAEGTQQEGLTERQLKFNSAVKQRNNSNQNIVINRVCAAATPPVGGTLTLTSHWCILRANCSD